MQRGGGVYKSSNYPTSLDDAESFVAEQQHGTLIATSPGGWPQTTILPFVKADSEIYLHAVKDDPTVHALRESSRASFFVSEFLAWTPHDWVDDINAARATLHFRAMLYECEAVIDDDPNAVARVLQRTVQHYEPDAQYEPLADGEFYGSRLRRLCSIRLNVVNRHAKFKLGPYGSDELKLEVASRLRGRDKPFDHYAAGVIESYVRGESASTQEMEL